MFDALETIEKLLFHSLPRFSFRSQVRTESLYGIKSDLLLFLCEDWRNKILKKHRLNQHKRSLEREFFKVNFSYKIFLQREFVKLFLFE